jgi:hypothetical protein
MFFVMAAAFVSVLCILGAARRAWMLGRRPEHVEQLARALRSGPPRDLGSDELDVLISDVLTAKKQSQAPLARLDEHLADVARELDVGSDVPRSAARIALFSGTALAVASFAREVGAGHVADAALGPLIAFSAGVIGGVGALLAGGVAERRAARLRAAYDELSARLERLVSTAISDDVRVDPAG